ncbi:MAG: hypothetical protein HXY38_14595 [Chloroflexi bacterium]|nr:hypothetical protein [Chloroflexota bacterium]
MTKASELTAASLRSVVKTISAQQLSRLTLPEIEAVVQMVSKMMPAGNVPGMILSGLARLPGRRIPVQKLQQDVTALFSGVEQILEGAVYGAFFAGPAAILWGYQNLLKLAGKDPESAFPEGAWQFYVDYALREDTARHANETHGFDTLLQQNNIRLDASDRLTAWFMAAVTILHQYDALLENEWRERVSISLLEQTMRGAGLETQRAKRILRDWELKRPYRRDEDGAQYDYPTYRRLHFEQFLQSRLGTLPKQIYHAWSSAFLSAAEQGLPAYQKQMSILACLEPGPYGETRVPFQLMDAKIGIIHHGSYYLLPVCDEAGHPLDVLTARAQIASLLNSPFAAPSQISALAHVRRSALAGLRSKLNPELVNELDNLKFAPILLSTDIRSRALPLSELRQTERGVGSHALTIFDTGETFVFDQSHIFFDGAWGTALAEIMTNEALSWARYLSLLPPVQPAQTRLFTSLALQISPADLDLIGQAPKLTPEIGAENDKIDLKVCAVLRKDFKQRNERIDLTINDLLVLYRAIHAATYTPSQAVLDGINTLSASKPDLAASLKQLVEEGSRTNPSILIPMDASLKNPRDRVHPMNLEVPLKDLNLLVMHAQTLQALEEYETHPANDRTELFERFNKMQKTYLAMLAGFGMYLARAKEIAAQGENPAAGAIKLLAHLPQPIQRLLDKIPEQFEVLNNLIKGREVFSNVGAVVPTSTLTRFMTAKDDNNQKQMAWGIITDANSILRIHLRDFRPHIPLLLNSGRKDLAALITQDYLDAYATGFNRYIRDLSRITTASRETMTNSRIKGKK